MNHSLAYVTLDAFEPDYLAHMIEEVDTLAATHTWWNQAFAVAADPSDPELLRGETKLMHRYLERDGADPLRIDYRDDVLMGAVDTIALLEMLTALSREHEFAWQLCQPAQPREKPLGRIIDGEIDPKLLDLLTPELEALEISEEELEDESLHQKIREKYGL